MKYNVRESKNKIYLNSFNTLKECKMYCDLVARRYLITSFDIIETKTTHIKTRYVYMIDKLYN